MEEEKDIKDMNFEDWERLMIPGFLSKPKRCAGIQGDLFEQYEYIADHIDN